MKVAAGKQRLSVGGGRWETDHRGEREERAELAPERQLVCLRSGDGSSLLLSSKRAQERGEEQESIHYT